MSRMSENLGASIFLAALCALGMFIIYLFFVWMPVMFYAEAKCLRQGYPKAKVSIALRVYCVNLDGQVKYVVEEQE